MKILDKAIGKIQWFIIQLFLSLGFQNINYSLINHSLTGGQNNKLAIGNRCSVSNTTFNLASGNISIGDDTIFGSNCMVITGQHKFQDGRRAELGGFDEIPFVGNDIFIGSGCFIGSGTIIIKSVKIGDNVLLGAGSVVVKDIPNECFAAGNPAKVIKYFKENRLLTNNID